MIPLHLFMARYFLGMRFVDSSPRPFHKTTLQNRVHRQVSTPLGRRRNDLRDLGLLLLLEGAVHISVAVNVPAIEGAVGIQGENDFSPRAS